METLLNLSAIINKVVQMFSRHHPITGLFQLSILKIIERKLLVKLSQGLPIDKIYVSPICSKIYALKLLFNSIPNNNDIASFLYIKYFTHFSIVSSRGFQTFF